jgi:nitrite reductase/ring-hydroxylating ferredoxin subunit
MQVVVEGVAAAPEPGLLQIGRRPADGPPGGAANGSAANGSAAGGSAAGGSAANGSADPAGDAGGAWITLPDIGPPSSRPVSAAAGGTAVLVCSVRGTLYAYLDACAACGSSMAQGQLAREELACPACGALYNVRLAGKGVTDPALHLDPLPLLADSRGVRVAMREAARS